jgi:hypothetical protein
VDAVAVTVGAESVGGCDVALAAVVGGGVERWSGLLLGVVADPAVDADRSVGRGDVALDGDDVVAPGCSAGWSETA